MPTHENLFKFTKDDIEKFHKNMHKIRDGLLLNIQPFLVNNNHFNDALFYLQRMQIQKKPINIDYSGIEQRIISSLPNIEDFAKAINIFKNLAPSAQELSDSLNKLKLAKVKLTDTEEKKKPYYQQQASIWANSWDTKLKKKLKK